MHGIWLHILADTMGSGAVIVSTALTMWFGWGGFDPLASCVIAILIFLSAAPLVWGSGTRLLLSIPADTEYTLRDILDGICNLRGVVGYQVPRFWIEDKKDDGAGHHDTPKTAALVGLEGEKVPDPLLGVMHIICSRGSNLDDVRERVTAFLEGRGMDVVVQCEKEGEGRCWCSSSTGPVTPMPGMDFLKKSSLAE
jgi:solute carrier family 30 (zinc transporter), member 5/7